MISGISIKVFCDNNDCLEQVNIIFNTIKEITNMKIIKQLNYSYGWKTINNNHYCCSNCIKNKGRY